MKIVKVMILMLMMIMMSEGNIIEQTCQETHDYNLCVSLLKSDPRASSADLFGLALILIDKIKGQALNTINEINSQYEKRPELSPVLKECSEIYKKVVNDYVLNANSAIHLGDSADADAAVIHADLEVTSCEKKFQGKSPLTSLIQSMHKICDVTISVVTLIN